MTADTNREMLHREPFEPFRVVTSSGKFFVVRNPHLLALMKSAVFIAYPNSDRRAYVPFVHITTVETLGNGRGAGARRRRRG